MSWLLGNLGGPAGPAIHMAIACDVALAAFDTLRSDSAVAPSQLTDTKRTGIGGCAKRCLPPGDFGAVVANARQAGSTIAMIGEKGAPFRPPFYRKWYRHRALCRGRNFGLAAS